MAENCKCRGQKVRPNISLEAMTKMQKMRYFGHVMRAHQSSEKDIMLGITAGARMDDIKSITGLSVNDLKQLVKDRKKWRLLMKNLVKKRKLTDI